MIHSILLQVMTKKFWFCVSLSLFNKSNPPRPLPRSCFNNDLNLQLKELYFTSNHLNQSISLLLSTYISSPGNQRQLRDCTSILKMADPFWDKQTNQLLNYFKHPLNHELRCQLPLVLGICQSNRIFQKVKDLVSMPCPMLK